MSVLQTEILVIIIYIFIHIWFLVCCMALVLLHSDTSVNQDEKLNGFERGPLRRVRSLQTKNARSALCKSARYHLHNISPARRYLTKEASEKAIQAFVMSRL